MSGKPRYSQGQEEHRRAKRALLLLRDARRREQVAELKRIWNYPPPTHVIHVAGYVPPRGSIARSFFGTIRNSA